MIRPVYTRNWELSWCSVLNSARDPELVDYIGAFLEAIEDRKKLIENHPHMDPSEKDLLLQNLVASIWAQATAIGGDQFRLDGQIASRSDLDVMQALNENNEEDLRERVRKFERRAEEEAP